MTRSHARTLVFHASLLMFVAFFAGFMIGAVATGSIEGAMDDWRLAHMEPLVNGLLLFAVAGCANWISLSAGRATVATWSLVGMAWCNTVFGLMRGFTGADGFMFGGSLANNITTAAGMLGVPLAMLAFGLIIIAVAPGKSTDD